MPEKRQNRLVRPLTAGGGGSAGRPASAPPERRHGRRPWRCRPNPAACQPAGRTLRDDTGAGRGVAGRTPAACQPAGRNPGAAPPRRAPVYLVEAKIRRSDRADRFVERFVGCDLENVEKTPVNIDVFGRDGAYNNNVQIFHAER